ncbi:DUF262 domain-containing protein [Acinetobacter soli]|uniref:DUF262 domain-containing protein n=1 Tax=Acinetobacter soli TaxID=487316 RepID=UPI00148F23D2|nr:DUF262 domain-containing protein [Acinetobacter soli]
MDKNLLHKKQLELEELFEKSQNRLFFQSSDLSFSSIADMVESKAIDIRPKYQRRERWTIEKQSALIESFVLNVPIPPIYLAEHSYGKYSVIDGKQRITAIYKFIKDNLKISGLEKSEELNDFTYDELPESLSNALKIRPFLRVIILLKQSDPELKYEVFNRLNTGGDNLLPQEIRNAMFEGELNDLLMELSENKNLIKHLVSSIDTYKKSTIYREMQDVEFVLRFFTVREYWENFPCNNMQFAMTQYMEEYSNNITEIQISKNRNLFKKSIEICNLIWEDKVFKRPDGSKKTIQGIYDSQMVSISHFIENGLEQKLLDKKLEIFNEFNTQYNKDIEYQNSMRQFTSNAKNVKKRIEKTIAFIGNIIDE